MGRGLLLRFVVVLLVLASLTLLELTFLEIEDADDPHHSSLRPSRSRARALLHTSSSTPKTTKRVLGCIPAQSEISSTLSPSYCCGVGQSAKFQ